MVTRLKPGVNEMQPIIHANAGHYDKRARAFWEYAGERRENHRLKVCATTYRDNSVPT
jgi:hypothetical protein